MKSARMLVSSALLALLAGSPAAIEANGPTTAGAPSPAVQPAAGPSDRLAVLVQSIRQAADPSSAIAAYASAQGVEMDNPALEQAYVQRMVELGLPEMADVQAQNLIKHDPQDGLGWAVAAYMSAKRDQSALALSDVLRAVKDQPQNVFVLRTAAQLIAWYDLRADKAQIPDDLKGSIETARKGLADQAVYSDAYLHAVGVYQHMAQTPTTGPAEAGGISNALPSTTAQQAGAGGQDVIYPPQSSYYYAPGNDQYQPYPNPYDSLNDPDDDYWWPGAFGAGLWWWPTWPGAVIFDRGFHHGWGRDGRFFHDGRALNDSGFFSRHGEGFAFQHGPGPGHGLGHEDVALSASLPFVQGRSGDLLIRPGGADLADATPRGDAGGPIILRRADDLDGGFVHVTPYPYGPHIIEPGREFESYGADPGVFADRGEAFGTLPIAPGRFEPAGPRFFSSSVAARGGFERGLGGEHFEGGLEGGHGGGGFESGHGGGFGGGGGGYSGGGGGGGGGHR